MKSKNATKTLHIAFFAALTLGMAGRAQAQECSLATVAGKYAFSDSGTVVAIGAITVNFPRAAVAPLTLNAAGSVSGKVTASLNGTVSHTTLSGTYTVNPDCTGTISFNERDASGNLILRGTADFVFDDNITEVRFIFTSAHLGDGTAVATVISGSARKLVPQNQQ